MRKRKQFKKYLNMNTKQLKQIKHNHRVKNEKKKKRKEKKPNRHSVITEKILQI